MKRGILITLFLIVVFSSFSVMAVDIPDPSNYTYISHFVDVGPDPGRCWRCGGHDFCDGETAEYNISGGYRFIDSIKQEQYEGTRGNNGYGNISVELLTPLGTWQYVGDMETSDQSVTHGCLDSTTLDVPNLLASKVRLTYTNLGGKDDCIRLVGRCSRESSTIHASPVISCECSVGETSCSGTDYLTCNDGCEWTNNGEVPGQCGVSLVETDCSDGIDDDGDGEIDCGDSDCVGDSACVEICDDGIDNDGDSLIDCLDSDCAGDSACVEICDDGFDNDGDGLDDCLDSDCVGNVACVTCTLANAYWETTDETDTENEGDIVSLTVIGSGVECDGLDIAFVVEEEDLLGRNPVITNPVSVSFNGSIAIGIWVAEYQDDGALQGSPEYLFTASLPSDDNIESVDRLNVFEAVVCIPKTCSEIATEQGVDEVCGSWDDEVCGGVDIDCGGEGEAGTCDETGGECILDESTGEGGCVVSDEILLCGGYDNEIDCLSDDDDVAKDDAENVYGVECGSDFNGCTIICGCGWDTNRIAGEECIPEASNTDCPDSGNNGVCTQTGIVTQKQCNEEPKVGFRVITSNQAWSGGIRPSWCPASSVFERKCINRVLLPFFTGFNLVIAILALIIFYIIVIKKKKKVRVNEKARNRKKKTNKN
tara:strand:+ start:220 stop:2175 length:1956 start_codon:yes stop_codon:yes gene_type:complete